MTSPKIHMLRFSGIITIIISSNNNFILVIIILDWSCPLVQEAYKTDCDKNMILLFTNIFLLVIHKHNILQLNCTSNKCTNNKCIIFIRQKKFDWIKEFDYDESTSLVPAELFSAISFCTWMLSFGWFYTTFFV